MQITEKLDGSRLQLKIDGMLDTLTAPELEGKLNALLPQVTELVLDLEELTYISSAGLRVIIGAQKTMLRQGVMKLIHMQPGIREIFTITGLDRILTIE